MLNFITKDGKEHSWFMGQARPRYETGVSASISLTNMIDSLVASDRELDYVRQTFTHLPMTSHATVVWKGAWAQFIYDNLRETM